MLEKRKLDILHKYSGPMERLEGAAESDESQLLASFQHSAIVDGLGSAEDFVAPENNDIKIALQAIALLRFQKITSIGDVDLHALYMANQDLSAHKHKIFYLCYFLYRDNIDKLIVDCRNIAEHSAYNVFEGVPLAIEYFGFNEHQYLELAKIFFEKQMQNGLLMAVRRLPNSDFELAVRLLLLSEKEHKERHVTDLFSNTLKGIADIKGLKAIHAEVIEPLLKSDDSTTVSIILFSVSIVDYDAFDNRALLPLYVDKIGIAALSEDEKLVQGAIYAYNNVVKRNADLLPLLRGLIISGAVSAKNQIINLLHNNFEDLQRNEEFRAIISEVPAVFNEVAEGYLLRLLLEKLVSAGEDSILFTLFENYINSESFDKLRFIPYIQIYHSIRHKALETFQMLIGRYLNSDNPSFHVVVGLITGEMHTRSSYNLALPGAFLSSLSRADKEFVILKSAGYISSHEIQLNILLSILDHDPSDEETANQISDLITDYLAYNYYSVIEKLKNLKINFKSETQTIINKIVAKSDQYFKAKSELPRLKELGPSSMRVNAFMKEQQKKVKEIVSKEKKQERSFLDMVNKVVLKGGKDWFMKQDGVYTQPVSLVSMERSIEMPQGEYIDPTQQIFLRMRFRTFRRENETGC